MSIRLFAARTVAIIYSYRIGRFCSLSPKKCRKVSGRKRSSQLPRVAHLLPKTRPTPNILASTTCTYTTAELSRGIRACWAEDAKAQNSKSCTAQQTLFPKCFLLWYFIYYITRIVSNQINTFRAMMSNNVANQEVCALLRPRSIRRHYNNIAPNLSVCLSRTCLDNVTQRNFAANWRRNAIKSE